MFKRIENWLRRIIAEVVRAERVTRADATEILEDTLWAFKAEAARLHSEELAAFTKMHNEAVALLTDAHTDILAEKNRLNAELHEKVAELQSSLSRFTQWKADEETKLADLIHQQPKR